MEHANAFKPAEIPHAPEKSTEAIQPKTFEALILPWETALARLGITDLDIESASEENIAAVEQTSEEKLVFFLNSSWEKMQTLESDEEKKEFIRRNELLRITIAAARATAKWNLLEEAIPEPEK